MTCDFTSFVTVIQSYQDDVWKIMKGCVQWDSVYGWEDFTSNEDRTRSARSVGQRLTHWATGTPCKIPKSSVSLLPHRTSEKMFSVGKLAFKKKTWIKGFKNKLEGLFLWVGKALQVCLFLSPSSFLKLLCRVFPLGSNRPAIDWNTVSSGR